MTCFCAILQREGIQHAVVEHDDSRLVLDIELGADLIQSFGDLRELIGGGRSADCLQFSHVIFREQPADDPDHSVHNQKQAPGAQGKERRTNHNNTLMRITERRCFFSSLEMHCLIERTLSKPRDL